MYKWNAKEYSNFSAEQQKWAEELLSKLALKGNERVLDIGCGDGKITAGIAQLLPEGSVLGIDNSKEMIRFAKENFPLEQFTNLTFEVEDTRTLSYNNESDVFFSNAALHWVIDHLPVLQGIQKSLKPTGKLLIQMGGKGNAANILKIIEKILIHEKWSKYFVDFDFPYGFYGPVEYKRWLEQAGFKIQRIELIPKDMIHKGKEGLSAWIKTTWLPYLQRIPDELCDDFINEIVGRYNEDHPPGNDGLYHIKMMRLEIEAGKKLEPGGVR